MPASRMALLAALLGSALSPVPTGLMERLAAARQNELPWRGRKKTKRGGRLKKGRQPRFCRAAYGRPVKYAQLAPKIDGIRYRWEKGELVPRT